MARSRQILKAAIFASIIMLALVVMGMAGRSLWLRGNLDLPGIERSELPPVSKEWCWDDKTSTLHKLRNGKKGGANLEDIKSTPTHIVATPCKSEE